jgi:hypothetical protein
MKYVAKLKEIIEACSYRFSADWRSSFGRSREFIIQTRQLKGA